MSDVAVSRVERARRVIGGVLFGFVGGTLAILALFVRPHVVGAFYYTPRIDRLFVSMHADPMLVEEAFAAGARGFVTKTTGSDELLRAIQVVSRGETYITPLLAGELISILTTVGPQNARQQSLTVRQRQTLQLLAEGKTMKEAAAIMNISTRTAECHKYEIMRKVGGETTADLIRYAIRLKLV